MIRKLILALAIAATTAQAQSPDPRLERLKAEAAKEIDGQAKFIQQMVDQVFSYAELGFQIGRAHV